MCVVVKLSVFIVFCNITAVFLDVLSIICGCTVNNQRKSKSNFYSDYSVLCSGVAAKEGILQTYGEVNFIMRI